MMRSICMDINTLIVYANERTTRAIKTTERVQMGQQWVDKGAGGGVEADSGNSNWRRRRCILKSGSYAARAATRTRER